jgi:serine/threonine-protein kinase
MPHAVDVLGLVGTTVEAVVFDACVDSGGFGLVYKGRHTGLDEPVAIKCLRIAGLQTADADMREAIAGRFRDETKLLYRLSQGHLDIVRCIGSGTLVAPKTSELTPYMILEWLEGQTLTNELRDRRENSQPGRSLAEAMAMLDSAVSALAYAHAQGIVHRDIKPGNLFLAQTREGVRMKVLDFGLAKILSDESLGVRPSVETAAGVHFCSPSYGAPEQLTGKAGPVGPWTDIYSLTLVLLEIMTGEKVRPATSLARGAPEGARPEDGIAEPLEPRARSAAGGGGSPRARCLW